jgi:hypothetical protein
MLPGVCIRNSLESLFQKEGLRGFVVWGHPGRIIMRPYMDLPCHSSGRAEGRSPSAFLSLPPRLGAMGLIIHLSDSLLKQHKSRAISVESN